MAIRIGCEQGKQTKIVSADLDKCTKQHTYLFQRPIFEIIDLSCPRKPNCFVWRHLPNRQEQQVAFAKAMWTEPIYYEQYVVKQNEI